MIHSFTPGIVALATPADAAVTASHARLRKHILQQRAQIRFRRLRAHAQPLDGAALGKRQHLSPSTIEARVRVPPPSIPSTTLIVRLLLYFAPCPGSRRHRAAYPPEYSGLPSFFGGVQAQHVRNPRIQIHILKRRTVLPCTISGPAAKKLAFISGILRGSNPCIPASGAWSGFPPAARARGSHKAPSQ